MKKNISQTNQGDKPAKRPRGRPPGRTLTHEARIMMAPAMWAKLQAAATKRRKSVGQYVRELIAPAI